MASEITVAGAGIFGLACAWAMLRRGQPVRVVEIARIGAGASGGHVGALAPHAPENWNAKKQVQLQALIAASDWWAEVADAGGVDPGYARTGRIQPVPQGAEARMTERIAAARAHWPDWAAMALTDSPDAALVPTSDSGLWLEDRLTARISPRRACAALAAAIRARGGIIDEGTTTEGPAIWATGAAGLAAFGGNGVRASRRCWALRPPARRRSLPTASISCRMATAPWPSARPRTRRDRAWHRRPAGCADRQGPGTVPGADRGAGAGPLGRAAPRAPSRAPLVGPWPGRPGDYVANGGFKIGLAMAPACAGMLADLILDGQDRIPDAFRPKAAG